MSGPANDDPRGRVRRLLAAHLQYPVGELADDRPLASLALDSFAMVEAVIRLQEDLAVQIGHEDLRGVAQVGDLVDVFAARLIPGTPRVRGAGADG